MLHLCLVLVTFTNTFSTGCVLELFNYTFTNKKNTNPIIFCQILFPWITNFPETEEESKHASSRKALIMLESELKITRFRVT